MNKIVKVLKKYMYVVSIFIVVSIILGVSYSNFIVTSNNHKAAEMYIGELKYSIEIDENSTNTLTIPTGETIIDVKVNNLNPVDTYYKLLYLKNSNLTVEYYETTKDTDDVVTTYSKPNDSITNSNSNTIKLKITNSSTASQNIGLSVKGGYITNTADDITTPSTYSEITLVETPSTNTYFCKTNNTLTQGLLYVNGQFTYAYKQKGISASNDLKWSNITNNGWGVQLTDKVSTKAVTNNICTYINNKPIISMSYMFSNSQATTIDLSVFNTSKVTNMSGMFRGSKAITLDLSNFNTSNVTNMMWMFAYSQATTIDLSEFSTSKVINMSWMFFESQVKTLDLSSFDTSNVTNMSYMFTQSEIVEIKGLNNFDTSKVTNMSFMFGNILVKTLDLSNFDISKVTDMSYMFVGVSKLRTIYVSDKFKTDNITSSTSMFNDCTNLVGGAGTTYDSNHVDKEYAHIDGGTSNPGYFTDVADKPSSFSTDDWTTIISSVKDGNSRGYKVGETKEIDLGTTYGTHTLRIANTSTPTECSNTGFSQSACGFVIEFADIISTSRMNTNGLNQNGWPRSNMYTFVNTNIYNSLPDDLKNGILSTSVVSGHESSSTSNYISTDKLYLLSPKEIFDDFSNTYDTAKDLTRQLDYYNSLGVTSKYANTNIAKKFQTSAYDWWLRTAYSQGITNFFYIDGSGTWIQESASDIKGVSPAFRIG